VRLPGPDAWGAWGGARRDAEAGANRALRWERRRADDAEKLADRERDGRERGVRRRDERRRWELRAGLEAWFAPALCRRDAGRFAARSYEAREWAEQLAGLRQAVRWLSPRERTQRALPVVVRDEPAVLLELWERPTAQVRWRLELKE
jgi:hypothetical protein